MKNHLFHLKKSVVLFILILLASCTSEKNKNLIEQEDQSLKTRYTFSQFEPIDFSVSGGSYQVLYDYSFPVDTLFAYSGAYIIGKDSIVYLRVRENGVQEFTDENDDIYHGSTEGLILYDGSSFTELDLPYFNAHFSSFTVKDKCIFYWGFNQDIHACKYDFKTNKSENELLQKGLTGTDYFGHYKPPYFDHRGEVKFAEWSGKTSVVMKDHKRLFENDESPLDDLFD